MEKSNLALVGIVALVIAVIASVATIGITGYQIFGAKKTTLRCFTMDVTSGNSGNAVCQGRGSTCVAALRWRSEELLNSSDRSCTGEQQALDAFANLYPCSGGLTTRSYCDWNTGAEPFYGDSRVNYYQYQVVCCKLI